jgi:undecaprenyl-diphosphatase
VAASRVYVGVHHASDVLAGAVLGAAMARTARKVWPFPAPAPRTGPKG